jgi:hypothetical protein
MVIAKEQECIRAALLGCKPHGYSSSRDLRYNQSNHGKALDSRFRGNDEATRRPRERGDPEGVNEKALDCAFARMMLSEVPGAEPTLTPSLSRPSGRGSTPSPPLRGEGSGETGGCRQFIKYQKPMPSLLNLSNKMNQRLPSAEPTLSPALSRQAGEGVFPSPRSRGEGRVRGLLLNLSTINS